MAEEGDWAPGCHEDSWCCQLTGKSQALPKTLEIAVQKEKVLVIQDWNLVRISWDIEMWEFPIPATGLNCPELPGSPTFPPCTLTHDQAHCESNVDFLTKNWRGWRNYLEAHYFNFPDRYDQSVVQPRAFLSPFLLSVISEKSDAVS